jgi:ABC-type phosphate/phosphonate transport system substrate-binding protein
MKGGVRFLAAVCLTFGLGAFLSGCDRRPPPKQLDEKDLASENELQHPSSGTEAGIVRFGFDHRASPEEDVKQYLPFLDYLSRVTGYHFEIHFTPDVGYMLLVVL